MEEKFNGRVVEKISKKLIDGPLEEDEEIERRFFNHPTTKSIIIWTIVWF